MASNFFSMYVMVRNISAARVKLPAEGFSIVAQSRQYDYVPLNLLLNSFQQKLALEQWQDPFNSDPLLAEVRDKNLDSYYELMASYFSFGDLQPGASKDGYLFYDKAVGRSQTFIFDALGKPIEFIKGK